MNRRQPPHVSSSALTTLSETGAPSEYYRCANVVSEDLVTQFSTTFNVPQAPDVTAKPTAQILRLGPALQNTHGNYTGILQPALEWHNGWFLTTIALSPDDKGIVHGAMRDVATGTQLTATIKLTGKYGPDEGYTYTVVFEDYPDDINCVQTWYNPANSLLEVIETYYVNDENQLPPVEALELRDIKVITDKGSPDSLNWEPKQAQTHIVDTSATNGRITMLYRDS
ncbi:hypothetical protein [Nocardia brasiliensis]|uniref:hypothetical protein n=1 Tax=Nocardia brasiliensis TaxID=37326 RepID=UPI0024552AA9|nr:hypothetical protein [Nocardia brasiliensis]